ncbi:MAG: rhodanese-like domain-containing protein [Halioglobus sp.]|nr:rhodanese-like domain-containing protein [Halioglobus sp.]
MALFFEFLEQEFLLVGALLAVIVMLVLHESRRSGPSVTPQQAINLVNGEDGLFLDLRDAGDYKQGHIVGAVNIPATKIADRMAELEKYRDKPIILVCKMGQQAGAAGKQLKAANYEKVYKMTGGMMEWSNLQLPTVAA